MMTLRLQIVIAVIILLGLSIVINMVRRKQIELKYALAWLGAGGFVLIFDGFPPAVGLAFRKTGDRVSGEHALFPRILFRACNYFRTDDHGVKDVSTDQKTGTGDRFIRT